MNASAFEGFLFQTVTSNFAETEARASADPTRPRPMIETLFPTMRFPLGVCDDSRRLLAKPTLATRQGRAEGKHSARPKPDCRKPSRMQHPQPTVRALAVKADLNEGSACFAGSDSRARPLNEFPHFQWCNRTAVTPIPKRWCVLRNLCVHTNEIRAYDEIPSATAFAASSVRDFTSSFS